MLKEDPQLKVNMFVDSKAIESVTSYNVIGEIKGKTEPEKTIVLGAHTDTWYNSPGAHDDGAGCVQMIDVIRIFKELDIQPNKTIRVVLFMDEELNQSGAKAYAESVKETAKDHYFALEADVGGFSPNGFRFDTNDTIIQNMQKFLEYLLPYNIYKIEKGFGGVDINQLKRYGIPVTGINADCQRYFEYHHSANDTFDKVYNRELQLGSAAIASLIYLIDKYGIY